MRASSKTQAVSRRSFDCPKNILISLKLHTAQLYVDMSEKLCRGISIQQELMVFSTNVAQGRPFLSGSQLEKMLKQAPFGQRSSYIWKLPSRHVQRPVSSLLGLAWYGQYD